MFAKKLLCYFDFQGLRREDPAACLDATKDDKDDDIFEELWPVIFQEISFFDYNKELVSTNAAFFPHSLFFFCSSLLLNVKEINYLSLQYQRRRRYSDLFNWILILPFPVVNDIARSRIRCIRFWSDWRGD